MLTISRSGGTISDLTADPMTQLSTDHETFFSSFQRSRALFLTQKPSERMSFVEQVQQIRAQHSHVLSGWVPDKQRKSCRSCNTKFSFLHRRHHCRCCGEVFDAKCTSKRLELPGFDETQRVCDGCFGVLVSDCAIIPEAVPTLVPSQRRRSSVGSFHEFERSIKNLV